MKHSKKKLLEEKKHDHDRKNMMLLGLTVLAIILFFYLA